MDPASRIFITVECCHIPAIADNQCDNAATDSYHMLPELSKRYDERHDFYPENTDLVTKTLHFKPIQTKFGLFNTRVHNEIKPRH